MKFSMRYLIPGIIALMLTLIGGRADSQDPPIKAEEPAAPAPDLPDELNDPAFARYIDLDLLSTALTRLDPALLTNTLGGEITNRTKYTLRFQVGGRSQSLAPGKMGRYLTNTSTGSVGYGVTWPDIVIGGIGVGGGEAGYVEGQRTYDFVQSGSNFSMRKTGWMTLFYYQN